VYTGPSSLLVTHVFDDAPFAPGDERFPLLVFSHGWGNPSFLYTAELEDLVSHGYIVMAVEHPYDTAYTEFSDGSITFFAHKAFDDAAKKPHGLNEYARERVEVMAQDNRFAIGAILKLASTKSANEPFYNRIDADKIAAVGHSIGGLASARTCQIDSRVRACVDQDSIDYRGSPFAASDLATVENQPFFLFVVSSADIWSSKIVNPTDRDLAQQKLSRMDYDNLIREEQANQDHQMSAISGGSYRLMLLDLPDFVHRSFSDLTLLAASVDHANALHNFQVFESYMLAFADKYLKGLPAPLLDDDKGADPRAVLEVFQAR
jgi:hypothetical protein